MDIFTAIIAFLEGSKYIFIFLGSFIEGSAVMMATGLLWHIGTVNFWPAYSMLMAGDILSDIMWYVIGYTSARPFFARWGYIIGATPKIIAKIERRFNLYNTRILIFSKLTMGFGLAAVVLTVAGMMRVSFVRYVVINALGSIIWVFALMSIGYFFGNVLVYVPEELKIIIAISIPILFLFAVRALNKKLATLDW